VAEKERRRICLRRAPAAVYEVVSEKIKGFDMIGIDVLNKVSTLFQLLNTSTDNPKFMYDMEKRRSRDKIRQRVL
jgi:hypothetical protein